MTQRAALLGGTLETRHDDGTWKVQASLPTRVMTDGLGV